MPESLGIVALCEAHATASNTTLPVALYKNSRLLGKLLLSIYRDASVGGGTIYGASLPGPGSGDGKYVVAKGDGSTVAFATKIPYAALSNNNYLVRVSKSARSNAGAATAAVTAGSKTVTGTSTSFTTELRVGDQISVNDEIRTVQQIVSTTSLIVDKAFTNSASGKTLYLVDGFLAPTTDFTLSDNGDGATITIGHASKVPSGCKIEIFLVTPVALFAFADATIITKKVELNQAANDVVWYVSDATATPSSTAIYAEAIGS